MNKELVMLVGLPGCGKSTYRAPYPDIVSSDHFIEAYAEMVGMTYNEVFESQIKSSQENMEANLTDFIKNGSPLIIWDQTNLTAKSRKKKLNQFDALVKFHLQSPYRKICIFFEPDLSLSMERNEARREFGRAIPQHILESMHSTIDVPKKSEGFDYVFHVPAD